MEKNCTVVDVSSTSRPPYQGHDSRRQTSISHLAPELEPQLSYVHTEANIKSAASDRSLEAPKPRKCK